jgi:hypothetical protein
VAAYRLALEEGTREQAPPDWAATQTNLGMALASLGERESGTARLEEAVAAYRDALEELTCDRVPLGWAMTLGKQGVALLRLAERRNDPAMAESALSQITIAFEVTRDGGHAANAENFEARLPEAHAIVERLRER